MNAAANMANWILQCNRRRYFKLDFDFGVETGQALVRPAEAQIQFHHELLSRFPTGEITVPALDDSPHGVFQIRTSWSLAKPQR